MKVLLVLLLVCAAFVCFAQADSIEADPELRAKTFYELLGVTRETEPADIKRSFRKISVKIHPDKARTAEERKVRAANYPLYVLAADVLTNEIKRKSYDRLLDLGRRPEQITDYDIENAWDKERQMWRDELGWAPLEDWQSLLLITVITVAVFGYPIYLQVEAKKKKKERKETAQQQKHELLTMMKERARQTSSVKKGE